MNLLGQQSQKLDVFEVEWSMLRNLVINLNNDSHSITWNHGILINSAQVDYNEDETMHQMKDDMDIEQPNSLSSNVG